MTGTVLSGLLAAARGLHMAGSFSLFGGLALSATLIPTQVPPELRRRLAGWTWGSLVLLLVAGAVWFGLQAADMSGAEDAADVWAALPVVAGSTRFGNLLIGRAAACLLAAGLWRLGLRRPAAIVAGLAVVAQAWLGHGGAMTGMVGNILLVSSVIHLASGGFWLGALPALRAALQCLPLAEAARLAARFSPVAMLCVAGLIASATVQFVYLLGGVAALFNTGYGLVVLGKVVLLTGLLGLAACNRFRFTPALAAGDEAARRALARSIAAEIGLGVLVLLAAGLLLQLTPPTMAVMLRAQGGS